MGLIQLLLFSSVLVGGGLAFYLRQNNKNLIQLLLSFSGAYILGITFLHLNKFPIPSEIDAKVEDPSAGLAHPSPIRICTIPETAVFRIHRRSGF